MRIKMIPTIQDIGGKRYCHLICSNIGSFDSPIPGPNTQIEDTMTNKPEEIVSKIINTFFMLFI